MGTMVTFHAHPDDECTTTGGSIARAAAEGHRVVLVLATNGDHGESPEDLGDDETLVARRHREVSRSAEILGISRVVWLGYEDSGMTGWPQNDQPGAFLRAPVEEAAERLAKVLREEHADVLTIYDWHGNYGHPDHIKVHVVGKRAAEMAGTPNVYEATLNRDATIRWIEQARAAGVNPYGPIEFDPLAPADDGNLFGTPESELTHEVDVSDFLDAKRQALMCHASQASDVQFFMEMPVDAFVATFGTEWFTKLGDPGPMRRGWLFE